MSIENLLEYIERQRLTAMPHRGCHWDRVLKWAEFFALQVSGYAIAIEDFVPASQKAAKLIWTCCHSLIEASTASCNDMVSLTGYSLVKTMPHPLQKLSASSMNLAFPFRFSYATTASYTPMQVSVKRLVMLSMTCS